MCCIFCASNFTVGCYSRQTRTQATQRKLIRTRTCTHICKLCAALISANHHIERSLKDARLVGNECRAACGGSCSRRAVFLINQIAPIWQPQSAACLCKCHTIRSPRILFCLLFAVPQEGCGVRLRFVWGWRSSGAASPCIPDDAHQCHVRRTVKMNS